MNPNFPFFTNHEFIAIKGYKMCVQHPYKKTHYIFHVKTPTPMKIPKFHMNI